MIGCKGLRTEIKHLAGFSRLGKRRVQTKCGVYGESPFS